MRTDDLAIAIRFALLGGFISSAVSAQDQDQEEDPAELDRISVTGTRIKQAEIEGASPIFILDRDDIEKSGETSVGDVLQNLSISGSTLNQQFNNGGNGETWVDLRQLGPNRVLVLLNGRRLVANTAGIVDINQIPIALIERIEILKDGASAIYGSEAVSGVVNIITRSDYAGMQLNAYIGQYQDSGDGQTEEYNFTVGASSDRGSMFFTASYTSVEPVFARDREISAEPLFGTGNAFASTFTPQGRFGAAMLGSFSLTTDPGANVTGPGGLGAAAFRPGDFSLGVPGGGLDRFNFAPDNYLLTPQERFSISTVSTYEITDAVRMSVEANYTSRESDQLLAPTPLGLGFFGSNLASSIGIGANNPFNPFGVALRASSFLLGRRLVEAGPRRNFQEVDNYRFGLGFEGSFEALDRYFDWNVDYVFGETERTDRQYGQVNLRRVQEALSDDCPVTPGCVPLNLFGGLPGITNPRAGDPGSITREMIDFISFVAQDARGSELTSYSTSLTGDLFELPAGPLAFATGYEHREEEGFDEPDALIKEGATSGNARQPTSGGFSTDEFFVEFAVPLLSNLPAARRLDLSLASRYSDYDTFGDTTNSKVGIEWMPIGDLLVRGTYSEGFRAPSIFELFGGQSDSFPSLTDPCSDFLGLQNPSNAQNQTVINNCISQGVPPDGSYVQANAQIRITVGSNPNLQPETSESTTFGFVYSPSWLDGFDLTVDYFEIELDNAIGATGPQTILNSCANTLQLCSLIQRNSRGQVVDLLNGGINLASRTVEGVDFLVAYSLPWTEWGFWRVEWDGAAQLVNQQSTPDLNNPDPDAEPIEQDFVGFNAGDQAFAKWRSNLGINWSLDNWEVTWNMHYVEGTDEVCPVDPAFGLCDLDLDGDGINEGNSLGSTTVHDVQVRYHLQKYGMELTLGARNVGDKTPPVSVLAFSNSFNVADYTLPERFPYVRVKIDF
ncbi:MAG: TonB-dependent receptor [Xanthomonadales bacterium]|nr:TonB-dependent receptor [Xanthomonadales bacterium]